MEGGKRIALLHSRIYHHQVIRLVPFTSVRSHMCVSGRGELSVCVCVCVCVCLRALKRCTLITTRAARLISESKEAKQKTSIVVHEYR